MTFSVTDMFCGAGGSSLGAEMAGAKVELALNHWPTAIDVHHPHFPDADHDCADVSAADPRRYRRTDILLASPECTNHSQARGVSRKRQDPSLWDAPDPSAEKSRATMWDVPKFAEQMLYDVIVTENVVEAAKWVGWRAWHIAMEDLGYSRQILSINAQDENVPQSRDRMYVVFARKGLHIDLERRTTAWCSRCDRATSAGQAWKNGRTIGRYRQQWLWRCLDCNTEVHPTVRGAVDIIDRTLPCPRIGDRTGSDVLVANTRARIGAGIVRYWPDEFLTAGAGNTYETTPGNRSRPMTDPLPVQQTTQTHAMVVPGGGSGSPCRPVSDPAGTITAGGGRHALEVSHRTHGRARPVGDPIGTVSAQGNHHALVMRNNSGGAEMITPVTEPIRTITTSGHQSLLMPYYGRGTCRPDVEPMPTVTTRDRLALITADEIRAGLLDDVIDDCGYRMFEPHEIELGMGFPGGYIPDHLPKRTKVKLLGNGNPPPVEQWIMGRVVAALGAA